uniref:CUB_2 domain-containing protein n=1 Tax=Steinernema glaseri TaxID=37863 RepID=A0A1I7Z894_9BILA
MPDLPFMLFGSDNVSKIAFTEAPCVFIASALHSGFPRITFRPENLEGSFGHTVNASSFVDTVVFTSSVEGPVTAHFGAFCFPKDTSYLATEFGDYSQYNSSSPEWRSTILYFMPRTSVEGPCKGRGTHKLGGNVFIVFNALQTITASANSACPAVVLAPTNVPAFYYTTSTCSIIQASVNSSENIDVLTVQNGVLPLKNTYLFTFTHSATQDFLRDAILLVTTSEKWTQNDLQFSYGSPYYGSGNCGLEINVKLPPDEKNVSGSFDTNPYGGGQVYYTLYLPSYVYTLTEFQFLGEDFGCMTLDMVYHSPNIKWSGSLQFANSFTLANVERIEFKYQRRHRYYDCALNGALTIYYNFRVLDLSCETESGLRQNRQRMEP